MKNLFLMATASALALSGCGETESTVSPQIENARISAEDMEAIRLHSACMISAVGLIGAYKLSRQDQKMQNHVSNMLINTTATYAAYHEISRLDLTEKYKLSDENLSQIFKRASDEHLSRVSNLNDQEAADYLRGYWSENCMSPEASRGAARLRESEAYAYSREKFMESQ